MGQGQVDGDSAHALDSHYNSSPFIRTARRQRARYFLYDPGSQRITENTASA
ncbi:hypothetical protein GPA_26750 [Gordonibacter pamelaeae 7-10-1-b]|uniref:Uncharacterized protein n=1 Tax=Gordonibacter pamelaeae 7-10-1-b TaxID=657308 RepID=D6EAI6_9ACTN|nr:hypothetical protein GPA_26750 [Gordonibacter pamelaeae 7-10-1-b]